jgi:hypothetical protein
MIEQIAAERADEAFGHAVLPGASNSSSDWNDAQALRGLQNLPMECGLAIKD